MMNKTLILGATGNISGRVAALLNELPDQHLRLTSSRASGVKQLMQRYPRAQVALLDWNKADDVEAAMAGVERVLFITPNFVTDERLVTANVIQAIRKAGGVKQVVRLLALPAAFSRADVQGVYSERLSATQHAAAKQLLDDSELPVTYVNVPCWIMFNIAWFIAEGVRTQDKVMMPLDTDSPRSWLAEDDIAQFMATLLSSDPQKYPAREHVITGHQHIPFTQLAALIGKVAGRAVIFEHGDAILKMQAGENFELMLTSLRHDSIYSQSTRLTSTFKQVMGRDPVALEQYLQTEKQLFAAS